MSGCYNVHQQFYIYKNPILNNSNLNSPRINGVYVINENHLNHPPLFLILYSNGLVCISNYTRSEILDKNTTGDSTLFISLAKEFNNKNKIDNWGSYSIINDSLIIQYFFNVAGFQTGLMNKNIINLYGKFINENSLILLEEKCTWWNKYFSTHYYSTNDSILIYKTPALYQFHPTDFKPDSSQAWFLKRQWYKKGLHESRK